KAAGGFSPRRPPPRPAFHTPGSDAEQRDTFVHDFGGITTSFSKYLEMPELLQRAPDTYELLNLLFTPASLNASLDVGFRGSPNVGAVVLNPLVQSKEMRYLAQSLQPGDRAFFISSIFGGTGAAGFPLLVKNLRDTSTASALQKPEIRRQMKTGALVVLPYFTLQDAASPDQIDSNNFITKTKTALHYYADNLTDVEALYYLGDKPGQPLPNHAGRDAQRNAAHLTELLGALALPHFMRQPDSQLSTESPCFHEYGLKSDAVDVDFSQWPTETREAVAQPLIRLHWFARYLQHEAKDDLQAPWAAKIKLDEQLKNNRLLRDELLTFFASYVEWLRELGANERRFTALRPDEDDFNAMVTDKIIETGFFDKGLTTKVVGSELSKAVPAVAPANPTEEESLRWVVSAFDKATTELLKTKLKYA
ncbi:MAG: hypothetical protein H7330_16000, partial [Hymenobacteraceae bacterium]|nr:hypothetical protein [Hymenobacteraceae bacterium]